MVDGGKVNDEVFEVKHAVTRGTAVGHVCGGGGEGGSVVGIAIGGRGESLTGGFVSTCR